jgi:alpha-L-fucosidase
MAAFCLESVDLGAHPSLSSRSSLSRRPACRGLPQSSALASLLSLFSLLSLSSCDIGQASPADASTGDSRDGGSRSDAGSSVDAGARDGGSPSDGGEPSDGGSPSDGGGLRDGGEGGGGAVCGLPPVALVPTPEQAAWQRRELTVFFHFGMNTFTDQEWGDGSESPSRFNPTALDAAQWISVIKNAGFRQVTLTAKHHDGFCLWPSAFTTHSVKSSPWKGGQGDVVGELTQAAHAAGIKVGLYLSPWDRHERTFGSAAYDTYFKNQLTELLSNYGEIDEVWFDGAGSEQQHYDWDGFYALIRKLQPHALIAVTGPDIRWVGNEAGIAPLGETSIQTVGGTPTWYPSESDVSIRPGWFYHSSQDGLVKTLDQLLDVYFKSVGRNSTLLLNIPPDRRGLIADADIARLGEFATALKGTYQLNLASGPAASVSADSTYLDAPGCAAARAVDGKTETFWAAAKGSTKGRLEIDLGAATDFNLVSVREAIELGERVTAYHLEVEQPSGAWETIASGTAMGQRNLLQVGARTARKLALVIDGARDTPAIAELSVHQTDTTGNFASGSLLAHKPVTVSNVHPSGTVVGGDKALDDDQQTRWATADGTTAAWLEVDLQSARTIGRLELYEYAPRISAFQLQYRLSPSDAWQVAYEGTTAGTAFKTAFTSVSARFVRLNITGATDPPTLWEVRVFPP